MPGRRTGTFFAPNRQNLEDAIRLGREANEPSDASRAEIALAQLDLIELRLEDASAHLESVLGTRNCISDDDVVQASWIKALIECDRGAFQSGMQLTEEARKIAREHQLIESEADCCRALASAYARSDQEEMASQLLDEAIHLASAAGDPLPPRPDPPRPSRPPSRPRPLDGATPLFEQFGAHYDLRRRLRLRGTM